MGIHKQRSHTLPCSPIHHSYSSSSDFEFAIPLSHLKSNPTNLRSADELFYKGQLLPLHFTSRNILARHSSDYHSSFSYETSDSSRPSSDTEDSHKQCDFNSQTQTFISNQHKKILPTKQLSFNRFSRVTSSSMKEKIQKYLKKLTQLHGQKTSPPKEKKDNAIFSSFSENLRFFRRKSCVSSCPTTMPSSPNHSGVLCRKTIVSGTSSNISSAEELHSAIQGAIAHCKISMTK